MEKKFFAVLFLVFMIFASGGKNVEVEAATCTKPSKYFRGVCGFKEDCVISCEQEGWPGGSCKYIFPAAKCICERAC